MANQNTLYVKQGFEPLLKLKGDTVVFYNSRAGNYKHGFVEELKKAMPKHCHYKHDEIIASNGRRIKLYDMGNLKTLVGNYSYDYENIYVVDIDLVDETVLFEVIYPRHMFESHKKLYANTVGDCQGNKLFMQIFANIKYS